MRTLPLHSALICLLLPLTGYALELTPQQQSSLKIDTVTLQARESAATVIASGTLQADQKRLFRVTPVVAGLVTDLNVVAQTTVRKGQLLAQLHSNALGEAQAEYLDALSRHEVAQSDLQRIQSLYKEGVVAESRLQEADSQHKSIQAMLDQKRRALTLAGVNKAGIEALTHQPDQLARYPLVSPANGVVLEVSIENGQMLAAGETAFRIADLSKLWAEIRIPVSAMAQIKPGSQVAIKVAAFPQQRFSGQLQSLSGEVEAESQTISGRAVIDNSKGLLRPGMYVQAELQGATESGLMAPASAIFRRGNDNYLFKVTGPRSYDPVKVTVGGSSNGWVSIKSVASAIPGSRDTCTSCTSGIAAGTVVVSSGVAELKSHWQYKGGE